MISKLPLFLALCLALPTVASAQNLKPLPNPDLSKLNATRNAEIREARANFDKARVGQSGSQLADLYADLGGVYARANLIEAADAAFENAASLAPNDDRWVYLRGVIARDRGQIDQAHRLFEKAFKLNPLYVPTRMALVSELLRENKIDAASKLLNDQLAAYPDSAVAHAVLGEIAVRQKQYAAAARHLNDALRFDPEATSLYRLLATAQEGAGDAKAASAARAKIGDGALRVDDLLLRRIASTVPAAANSAPPVADDPRSALQLQVVEQASAGQFDAARKSLETALKQFPNDAAFLTQYARVEMAAGNASAARARAKAAVAANPKSAQVWMTQGVILESTNDDAGARDSYIKASINEPNLGLARVASGNLAMRTGQYNEAITAYRSLVNLQADNARNWTYLLAAQFAGGQCASGMREAIENEKKHPRDPLFAELSIRAVSTCPAATPEQKKTALANAEKLYGAAPPDAPQIGEAYALALAANGKWEDAKQTQGAAMFVPISAGNEERVAQYREFYQRFEAKQLPTKPWADIHPLTKPPRPQMGSAPQASQTPAGK